MHGSQLFIRACTVMATCMCEDTQDQVPASHGDEHDAKLMKYTYKKGFLETVLCVYLS